MEGLELSRLDDSSLTESVRDTRLGSHHPVSPSLNKIHCFFVWQPSGRSLKREAEADDEDVSQPDKKKPKLVLRLPSQKGSLTPAPSSANLGAEDGGGGAAAAQETGIAIVVLDPVKL